MDIRDYWLSIGDTEEHYDANKKQLLDLGWTKENIIYEYNDAGFRSEEFYGDDSCGMFVGCSFTYGMGLNLESTWGHIVARKLGLRYCSVAKAGYSNDACFREVREWISVIKPEKVFMLAPPSHRFETKISENRIEQFQIQNILNPPDSKPAEYYDCAPYAKIWCSFEDNYIINREKNFLAIKQICADADIPFYYLQSESFPYIKGDFARDLQHPGKIWQQNIANEFLKMVNNCEDF